MGNSPGNLETSSASCSLSGAAARTPLVGDDVVGAAFQFGCLVVIGGVFENGANTLPFCAAADDADALVWPLKVLQPAAETFQVLNWKEKE